MTIELRKFTKQDIADAIQIWNQVVEDGVAFPQMDMLDEKTGTEFLRAKHILELLMMLRMER